MCSGCPGWPYSIATFHATLQKESCVISIVHPRIQTSVSFTEVDKYRRDRGGLTAARVANIAVRTGCKSDLVAGALILDAVSRANPVTFVKGFSVLLAAIILPSRPDCDTEDEIALDFAFRLVTGQAFVPDIVRVCQLLFVFPAGFVVTVKQLVYL